jgi:hypothetical protein
MGKLVAAVLLLFGLACGQDGWERAVECKALVESGEQCVEYKTLKAALDGAADNLERKKITLLYKLFGPTPTPMCERRGAETWSFWQRRKFEACKVFLEDFKAGGAELPEARD